MSGFLIGSILIRSLNPGENSALSNFERFKRFWIRRAFRIIPVYYLILISYILLFRIYPLPTTAQNL